MEVKKLITLLLIALAFIAVYFLVKNGTLTWLTGKPCKYGDLKMHSGQTYYDKYYDYTIKCDDGQIIYQ